MGPHAMPCIFNPYQAKRPCLIRAVKGGLHIKSLSIHIEKEREFFVSYLFLLDNQQLLLQLVMMVIILVCRLGEKVLIFLPQRRWWGLWKEIGASVKCQ